MVDKRNMHQSQISIYHSRLGIVYTSHFEKGEPQTLQLDALEAQFASGTSAAEFEKILESSLLSHPTDVTIRCLLAVMVLKQDRNIPSALFHALVAVAIDSVRPSSRYLLGMVYLTLDRLQDARREWRIVQQLTPSGTTDARNATSMLRATATDEDGSDIVGEGNEDNERILSLMAQFHALAKPRPDNLQDWNRVLEERRKIALEVLGQPKSNGEDILPVELVTEILSVAPRPILSLARPEVANDRLYAYLSKRVSDAPDDVWARFNLAATLLGLGRRESAKVEAELTASLALHSSNHEAENAALQLSRDIDQRAD